MALNANQVNAYRQTRVRTASQGQIIIMLYDEAVKQIDLAVQALDESTRQLDRVHNAVVKAQDIVTELMVSLDFDKGGDVARNLFNLYMYFSHQLNEGNFAKDPEPLRRVRSFMAELRQAWEQVVRTAGHNGNTSSGGVDIAG